MSEAMQQQFGLIQRPWGVYYLKNKITGEQTTLKTRDKEEALRLLAARNDSESQPHLNLALARVYMNGADPHLATRTWQEVMEHIVAKKTDETRRRWEVAIKDVNFDCIRNLPVAETAPWPTPKSPPTSTSAGYITTPSAWNGSLNRSFRACNGHVRCSSRNAPSPRRNTRQSSNARPTPKRCLAGLAYLPCSCAELEATAVPCRFCRLRTNWANLRRSPERVNSSAWCGFGRVSRRNCLTGQI